MTQENVKIIREVSKESNRRISATAMGTGLAILNIAHRRKMFKMTKRQTELSEKQAEKISTLNENVKTQGQILKTFAQYVTKQTKEFVKVGNDYGQKIVDLGKARLNLEKKNIEEQDNNKFQQIEEQREFRSLMEKYLKKDNKKTKTEKKKSNPFLDMFSSIFTAIRAFIPKQKLLLAGVGLLGAAATASFVATTALGNSIFFVYDIIKDIMKLKFVSVFKRMYGATSFGLAALWKKIIAIVGLVRTFVFPILKIITMFTFGLLKRFGILYAAFLGLQGILQGLAMPVVIEMFENIGKSLYNLATNTIFLLGDAIDGLGWIMSSAMDYVLGSFKQTFSAIGNIIELVFPGFIKYMTEGTSFLEPIGDFFSRFTKNLFSFFWNLDTEVPNMIESIMVSIAEAINYFVTGQLLDDLSESFSSLAKELVPKILNAVSGPIKDFLQSWGISTDFIDKATNKLKGIVDQDEGARLEDEARIREQKKQAVDRLYKAETEEEKKRIREQIRSLNQQERAIAKERETASLKRPSRKKRNDKNSRQERENIKKQKEETPASVSTEQRPGISFAKLLNTSIGSRTMVVDQGNQSAQDMRTSQQGRDMIKSLEGFASKAYWDHKQYSIGYGSGTINGRPVQPGDTITKAQADAELVNTLGKYEDAVRNSVNVPLTQGQFDALVSFAYNVGPGALAKSTLVKKLNAGDYKGAANEFQKWNKASGKDNQGLNVRRQKEMAMFAGSGFTGSTEPASTAEQAQENQTSSFMSMFGTGLGNQSFSEMSSQAYALLKDVSGAFPAESKTGPVLAEKTKTAAMLDSQRQQSPQPVILQKPKSAPQQDVKSPASGGATNPRAGGIDPALLRALNENQMLTHTA